MNTNDKSKAGSVAQHYDAVSENYGEQYDKSKLYTLPYYPSNYFRLQLLIKSFEAKGIKEVIEVGVGEGTPLKTLAEKDVHCWGFDISEKMVELSKQKMEEIGHDPNRIFLADIEDPNSYEKHLKAESFDGLVAMGVMPHVKNDDVALTNMKKLVKPGGSVFIEFRNKLFSLFTFNRYTHDFIMNDLLEGVSEGVRKIADDELKSRLNMNVPPVRDKVKGKDAVGYDAILSKFHNPFEIEQFFKKHGFQDIKLLWYHYHPMMPMLEGQSPEEFRKEAINLEFEPSGWKGYFLCSAFVVEAIRGE